MDRAMSMIDLDLYTIFTGIWLNMDRTMSMTDMVLYTIFTARQG